MDLRGDSLEELSSPSFSSGSVTQFAKKPPPLRIVVPPTEYCPFSTDLTLPSTPLSLPTPVSSSCFTFTDRQGLVNQSVSAPPTPTLFQSSGPGGVVDSASPTSSRFLLMPSTPHLENVVDETAICLSPSASPGATNEPRHSGSDGTKPGNLRPWEVSSSTWLSDLGGPTETDRIFRHNLLKITSIDTESSPASTPVLSPNAISPSSQTFPILAYSPLTSTARSPASFPATLSPYPCTMRLSSSPTHLVLKPTGTDTFPSTLDNLQAWRESVTPGLPQSEESRSPLSEDVHSSRLQESRSAIPTSSSLHPRAFSPRASRTSKSQTFIKHAKMFGGRVKRLITRQSVHKHRSSMDRGVNFRVVTSQDSENGSVILIIAPPLPYDSRPPTLIRHSSTRREHVRSRTTSEYSSAVQTSTVELATSGMNESGPRQVGSNRSALRRLSLAALSTMKRL